MKKTHAMRVAASLIMVFVLVSPSVIGVMAQEIDPMLDTDGDGVTDWDEINRYWSDETERDTDGDTIDDGREVRTGTSPILTDSDGDFISDTYEYANWNPLATEIENRYHLCPYLADLPRFSLAVENDEVVNHYNFVKGDEQRGELQSTLLGGTATTIGMGARIESSFEVWTSGWARTGLMSQDVGFSIDTPFGGGGANFPVIFPYVELMSEVGYRSGFSAMSYLGIDTSFYSALEFQGTGLLGWYSEREWTLSEATLLANVSITNAFDRTIQLESVIFDVIVGNRVYQSSAWDIPPIVLGQGESYIYAATWDVDGEQWIQWLTQGSMQLSLDPNTILVNVWNEEADDWVSKEVMEDHVQEQCALVEVAHPDRTVTKFITANVDKLDGLNVLTALDRLFIDYTYKYGRMIDLMGTRSRPGEEVWAFAYFEQWYDTENPSDETNFDTLRMWGRGALTVDLQKDSDGDWLIDTVETRIGTSNTDQDTDDDFADDYNEVVLMRSNPFAADTDGGGTIDGIEYFDGLDANDPSDDKLETPDWYRNHAMIQNSYVAANNLLDRATRVGDDQLTWAAPQSPAVNTTHDYDGIVTWVMNETWATTPDQEIETIEVGDADEDGDMDVVVGTSPYGLVILYENVTEMGSSYMNYTLLANFSDIHSVYPVYVNDVMIGSPEEGGAVEILAGTWYNDGTNKGDIHRFYKSSGVWNRLPNSLNQISRGSYIPGGVYSLDIGLVGDLPTYYVVVGEGGIDNLGYCNVSVIYQDLGTWYYDEVVITNQSRVVVTIGDLTDAFGGNEIVYCTNSVNSSLGYVGYKSAEVGDEGFYDFVIDHQYIYAGHSPPYTTFMALDMGDMDGVGPEDAILMVAVDSTVPDNDTIYEYGSSGLIGSVIQNLHFSGPEFVFDDFDNDGNDEIAYATSPTITYPRTELRIYEYNKTGSLVDIVVENTTGLVASIEVGDIDGDNVLELLYGTDGAGEIVLWDHPNGALWADETMNWTVQVTMPEPWIYEGEYYPISVLSHSMGDYAIEDLSVTIEVHEYMTNLTSLSYEIANVAVDDNETVVFKLQAEMAGNYTLELSMVSVDPAVSFEEEYSILVKARPPSQARIAMALLDLATYTGNDTLLDEVAKIGNWFAAQRVYGPIATYYGWNADANFTDEFLPGHIQPTVEAGRFLRALFHATGNQDYLVHALGAARYLMNSTVAMSTGLGFSSHERGIVDVAMAGVFMLEVNSELLFDLFSDTVLAYADYLISESTLSTDRRHWYGSMGLTEAALYFFSRLAQSVDNPDYYDYAVEAANWLEANYASASTPGVRAEDPYGYYIDSGLAGVGIALGDFGDVSGLELADVPSIEDIGHDLVDMSYLTGQGRNWQESSWTLDVEDLIHSVNMEYGAAGTSVNLIEAFKHSGNQTFMDYALEAVTWMGHTIDEIGASGVTTETCGLALTDIIEANLHIHSIIPVIVVGYFVDPMTSLSGQGFTLSGYVQTLGYHATGVNLTAILSPALLLNPGEPETQSVGYIAEPSAHVRHWDITLLLYGEFNITIEGESNNAGDQDTTQKVVVTDLGVNKILEEGGPVGRFISLHVLSQVDTDILYNVGENVVVPIEALYEDGTPAYNASIEVGGHGLAVVNGSGYAYISLTSWDPGVDEFDITIRYDKNSGITDGTSNVTVSLIFTSLEVDDANVSATSAQTGELVTFQGRVLYSHDGSAVDGATVALDGVAVASTDANGYYSFTHTETTEGTLNHTVTATSDGDNRIDICSQDQVFEITWGGFWTPTTQAIVIGGGVAGLIVVIVIIRKLRKPKV